MWWSWVVLSLHVPHAVLPFPGTRNTPWVEVYEREQRAILPSPLTEGSSQSNNNCGRCGSPFPPFHYSFRVIHSKLLTDFFLNAMPAMFVLRLMVDCLWVFFYYFNVYFLFIHRVTRVPCSFFFLFYALNLFGMSSQPVYVCIYACYYILS